MRSTPFRIALALAAALLASGLSGVVGAARAQDAAAAALLQEGLDAEAAHKLEDACQTWKKLLDAHPKDAVAPRARLRLGLALAKLGRVEEARARLREARATGKSDEALCKEAEQALVALPPAPEPKPEPKKPAPGDAGSLRSPSSAPKAPEPETGPRAELAAEIAKLEDEVRGLVKRAQEAEDANRQGDAFALRAQADKKAEQLEAKKKELAALPRGNAKPRPIDRKLEKLEKKNQDDEPTRREQKRKMMARRKAELENTAKQADQRAAALAASGRTPEATEELEKATRARREAFEIAKRLEKLERDDAPKGAAPAAPGTPAGRPAPEEPRAFAPAAAQDPLAKNEQEAHEALQKARQALAEAERAKDPARVERARDGVAFAEKNLAAAQNERETALERTHLDRLAEQLKKRGAPGWEVEERLALARKEGELVRAHRRRMREAKGEDAKEQLAKEHRAAIERFRAEGEERIAARARTELENDLKEKRAELIARGVTEADADKKVAQMRRERENRLGMGKRDKDDDDKDDEKDGQAPGPGKRVRRLIEENLRLRKRIEDLERENAALKARQGSGTPQRKGADEAKNPD